MPAAPQAPTGRPTRRRTRDRDASAPEHPEHPEHSARPEHPEPPGQGARPSRIAGLWPYLLIAPTLAGTAYLLLYPLIRSVVISFQHFRTGELIRGGAEFVGLGNYAERGVWFSRPTPHRCCSIASSRSLKDTSGSDCSSCQTRRRRCERACRPSLTADATSICPSREGDHRCAGRRFDQPGHRRALRAERNHGQASSAQHLRQVRRVEPAGACPVCPSPRPGAALGGGFICTRIYRR